MSKVISQQPNVWEKWDRGEFTYSKPEEKLMNLKEGEKIGNILEKCTKCPVGNATCLEYFEIKIHGIHPEKKMKTTEIMFCPLGITSTDACPLNK